MLWSHHHVPWPSFTACLCAFLCVSGFHVNTVACVGHVWLMWSVWRVACVGVTVVFRGQRDKFPRMINLCCNLAFKNHNIAYRMRYMLSKEFNKHHSASSLWSSSYLLFMFLPTGLQCHRFCSTFRLWLARGIYDWNERKGVKGEIGKGGLHRCKCLSRVGFSCYS